MGIASFSPTGLLETFQDLVGWFTASAPPKRASRASHVSRAAAAWPAHCTNRPSSPPVWIARPNCSTLPSAVPRRPVRVLRVIDTSHSSASAGRMRISGRMADVCAELDRMAALESPSPNTPSLQ